MVCKNFLFSSVESHYPILHRAFEKMMVSPEKYVHRFMTIPIPLHFVTRLEEYNAIFGQQQIENIHYTISLIKNKNRQDKIENLIKTNVQKCIAWCIKYNIPFFSFTNNVGNSPSIFSMVGNTFGPTALSLKGTESFLVSGPCKGPPPCIIKDNDDKSLCLLGENLGIE